MNKTKSLLKFIKYSPEKRGNDELRFIKKVGRIIIHQDSFDRYHFLDEGTHPNPFWLNGYSDSALSYELLHKRFIMLESRDKLKRLIDAETGDWIILGTQETIFEFREINISRSEENQNFLIEASGINGLPCLGLIPFNN